MAVVTTGMWHTEARGPYEGNKEVLREAGELCAEDGGIGDRGSGDDIEPAKGDGVYLHDCRRRCARGLLTSLIC